MYLYNINETCVQSPAVEPCRADKLFDSNVQIILICFIHSSLQNERNLKRYHLINETCKSGDLD